MLSKLKEYGLAVELDESSSLVSKSSSTPKPRETLAKAPQHRRTKTKNAVKEFNPVEHVHYMRAVSVDAPKLPESVSAQPARSGTLFPYLSNPLELSLQKAG